MRAPPVNHQLTLEEYEQLEEENQQRYEYHDGEVFAMAGAATDVGDTVHNAVCHNLHVFLGNALRKKPCNVFTSDQKVRIKSINRSLYPDASVTCGLVDRSEKDTKAITNPVLLVEVLSDSTEAYDRGKKFEYFSKLPSLREYMLIEQHEPAAQIHYRTADTDLWQITWVAGLDKTLTLQSLDIETTLRELYLKTEGL
ncbi:MAG: Uma2 family endonuclease [Tunicatimonas sp.]